MRPSKCGFSIFQFSKAIQPLLFASCSSKSTFSTLLVSKSQRHLQHVRTFSSNQPLLIKKTEFPARPKISEDEIEEVFIKGGGKGGQKVIDFI